MIRHLPIYSMCLLVHIKIYGIGKKSQAALGFEPTTTQMQSGALGAWPPCHTILSLLEPVLQKKW
jgi:hypothetical protein